ncbi:unnamed protein product [Linum trigynum]|uniref:Cytochrome P450 n=2 Tax=Linum trigynum TaxID=586398 RepID=A0AAV2GRC5_9ROSI
MFWLAFLVVTISTAITVAHWAYKWSNPKPTTSPSTSSQLPPGSMGWPLIGETFQFFARSDSLEIPPFLRERSEKYGKIFKTSLAGRRVVVSSDPDFNHYILQQEGKLVELWYLDSFAEIIGQSTTSLKEAWNAQELHKSLKKSVYDHIGVERLKGKLVGRMEEMVGRTLDGWAGRAEAEDRGGVEVKRACSKMVMELSSNILFGHDPTKFHQHLSDMFESFTRGLLSFPLKIPGTTFHACLQSQKKILRIIMDVIEERRRRLEETAPLETPAVGRRGGGEIDLLDQLIDDARTKGFPDDKGISYLIFGLLFANAETIPSVLTLALSFLDDHPLLLHQLVKENEEILRSRGSTGGNGLTWKEYKSMSFTMNVINEALRLNGSVGIIRRTIEDVHINGYVIPKGWTIAVMPTAVHMNPDVYQDPLSFNPSRWKDIGGSTSTKNFIPFGGGMRTCVGAEYSKALMAVFLHVLVTKYRWKKVKRGRIYRAPTLQFGDGYFIHISRKND